MSSCRATNAKVGLTVFACHARDATPADLARAGYERLGPEVLRVSAAEWHAMKLRAEGREAHGEPGTLAHLRNDGGAVRRFEVVRADEEPGRRRIIEVANMEGPRDAVERFAEEVDCGQCVVSVRERGQPSEWTMWNVEPVTTYRARPV